MNATNNNQKKDKKPSAIKGVAQIGAGAAGIVAGKSALESVHESGFIDGRVKKHVSVPKEELDDVLSNGLRAKSKNSMFDDMMKFHGKDTDKLHIFSGKRIANMAAASDEYGKALNEDFEKNVGMKISDIRKKIKKNNKVVETSIPLEAFKGMNQQHSPYQSIKKSSQFREELDSFLRSRGKDASKMDKSIGKHFKEYAPLAYTLDGSVAPEHIKGGKGYVKNSPKQILNHIKNNKGHAAFGTGLALGGAGLAAGSAWLVGKGAKNIHDKYVSKKASIYIDEIEKIALDIQKKGETTWEK